MLLRLNLYYDMNLVYLFNYDILICFLSSYVLVANNKLHTCIPYFKFSCS